jgi:glycine/serine hydroxymethyltransferase
MNSVNMVHVSSKIIMLSLKLSSLVVTNSSLVVRDNNIIVIDFSGTEMDGKKSELTLDAIGISTSKSTIPDDPNPPFRPSGLRLGLPAMTTRGIREA